MKRSEMIKRLQKRFYFGEGEVIADLADEIIDFLVNQGMQPPAYRLYSLDREWDCYDWEDEDEKK